MTDGVALTPREREFEAVCLEMLAQGVKPTPANLEPRGFGNGRTIRGNYVRIRTRLLRQAGYRKGTDKYGGEGQWRKR
jgi:hypothetical protein